MRHVADVHGYSLKNRARGEALGDRKDGYSGAALRSRQCSRFMPALVSLRRANPLFEELPRFAEAFAARGTSSRASMQMKGIDLRSPIFDPPKRTHQFVSIPLIAKGKAVVRF